MSRSCVGWYVVYRVCGMMCLLYLYVLRYRIFFFFFNDTATTEIYTLSLHDALPILRIQSLSQIPIVVPIYIEPFCRIIVGIA